MSRVKALEMAENPSVYWKEGKKKRHPGAARAFEVFLSYLLVFLLCIGSVLVYDSVFPIESPLQVLFLGIGMIEILLFFVYLLPALRRLSSLLTACGFLVGFLFLREPIISGLKQCAGEVIRKFNAHFGTEIFVFQEVEEAAFKQTAIYFMVLLFLWWFVEALLHFKNIPLLSVPPLCLVCGELLVGKAPDELPLLMVAGAFFILLSLGNGRHIKAESGTAGIRGKSVLILTAMILLSLFLTDRYGREKAENLVKLQNEVLSYQFALERQIMEYTPRGLIGQSPGRISNKAPKYDGKEVLSVTTDRFPAGNVYLRGYVGDTYRNGNWTNRSQLEFEDTISNQLAYADQVEAGSYVQNLFYQSQVSALSGYRSKYQIHYTDTKEDYAYLPYMADLLHVSKDGRTMSPLLTEADAMIYREGADSLYADVISPYNLLIEAQKGEDYAENKAVESCYSSYLSQYLRIPSGLTRLNELGRELRLKMNQNYKNYHMVGSLVAAKEIYAACLVRDELFRRVSYSLELDKLPFGEDVVEYFLFDSGKGFCEHYASAGVLLLRQMGIPARYVSGYVIRPEEFIRKDNAGGSTDAEYTAVVKDDAAHAWVEVFIEHVGWVPVEMTEGSAYEMSGSEKYDTEYYEDLWQSGGNMENALPVSSQTEQSEENKEGGQEMPDGTEPDGETQEKPEEEDQVSIDGEEETQGKSEESEAAAGEEKELSESGQKTSEDHMQNGADGKNGEGSDNESGRKTGRLLVFSVVFLIAGGVGIFIYTKALRSRKEAVRQKDPRKAIAKITADLNRMLQKRGVLKLKGLDDKGYRQALVNGLPMIPKEELDAYFLVLERTAYSNEPLGEEDVLCCYRVYKKIKEK